MIKTSVKVTQGIVKGCQEILPNGKSFFKFSGIPYAEKPLNNLKFKAPQKLHKFETPELDCTHEREACFHRSVYNNLQFTGSEDCLYLNVYVPNVSSQEKLAVMLWIHGGAFLEGSGSELMFSPEYLLMENVIVVSINYRLHALGFLMLPSMGINGNAGLKDQQMALEWVYENIEQFNGDRDRICLLGESAGGASVHLQVLNQKSRKMISAAICQSGNALGDWVIQRDPIGCTKRLAELLGCKSSSDKDIYETLMSADLEDLFKKSAHANSRDDRRRNLNMTFKPVIEIDSNDAFMIKSPVELIITQKDQINIPLIFGCTNKEGIIQTSFMKKNFASYNKEVSRLVPLSLNIDPDSAFAMDVGKEIKNFYFKGGSIDDEHEENFIDLQTDLHFLTSQTMCNEILAKYQNCKQYLYEFRFDGELNILKKILQMDHCKGACHADELYYLFVMKMIEIELDDDSPARKMRDTMCKLWSNFAKHGKPHLDVGDVVWKPVADASELNYLIIDSELKMEKNINGKRMNFWRQIYKTWNKDFLKPKL